MRAFIVFLLACVHMVNGQFSMIDDILLCASSSQRCGIMQIGVVMKRSTDDDFCIEFCSYFPILELQSGTCESCPESPSLSPIVEQPRIPTIAPVGAPVDSAPVRVGPPRLPTIVPVGDITPTLPPVDLAPAAGPLRLPTRVPTVVDTNIGPPRLPTGVPANPNIPTGTPVRRPTKNPTGAPVPAPVQSPVRTPTSSPVRPPTPAPVQSPVRTLTSSPVRTPTRPPTLAPVRAPVRTPTRPPTPAPVRTPTRPPTPAPVRTPTRPPTPAPVSRPTRRPTPAPVAIASPAGSFPVTQEFINVPASDQGFFIKSLKRWQDAITSSSETVSGIANIIDMFGLLDRFDEIPRSSFCNFGDQIENLYICNFYHTIDGLDSTDPNDPTGGVLAIGGNQWVRPPNLDNGLPLAGYLVLDRDDVAQQIIDETIEELILHEFGHVLGIGTLNQVANDAGSFSTLVEFDSNGNCAYLGANANREFRAISGCSNVPLENGGNEGTTCAHFDEECLQGELMTGFVSGSLSLSRITLGFLNDIGYSINYDASDSFTTSDINSSCVCNRRLLEEESPIFNLDGTRSTSTDKENNTYIKQLRKPHMPHRRLSESMRDHAVSVGMGVLNSQIRPGSSANLQTGTNGPTVTATNSTSPLRPLSEYPVYVGDQAVSVVVKDGDAIYHVHVTR